jgi:Zn finger protein HypA/HybF involved in hydrogenase expression
VSANGVRNRIKLNAITPPVPGDGTIPLATARTVDELFNNYLTDLDPRGDSDRSKALRSALAASSNKRFQAFLDLLYQRRCAKWSFAVIAKACDITLGEFQAFWMNAELRRGVYDAACGTPDIVKDMIIDARSEELTCRQCDGEGKVASKDGRLLVCPVCGGRGRIRKIGDAHSRDKLLEIAGLTGKRGPLVQINATYSRVGIDAFTERISKIPFCVDVESEVVEQGDGIRRAGC